MAELCQKRKITHILKISAQSEQLQQRYCRFYWFLKIACLRYEGPWGRDCVSGVPPCLVHSQNLSELIGHSDGGHKRFRTAVRARLIDESHLKMYVCNFPKCILRAWPSEEECRQHSLHILTFRGKSGDKFAHHSFRQ